MTVDAALFLLIMPIPTPGRPITLIAPPRSRRSWMGHRSRGGRFGIALGAGGIIALMLGAWLPGQPEPIVFSSLVLAGIAMTVVATLSGFIPSLISAIFAPMIVVVARGVQSAATFGVFVAAAVLGTLIQRWGRSVQHRFRRLRARARR